jgi:hypothetical protein
VPRKYRRAFEREASVGKPAAVTEKEKRRIVMLLETGMTVVTIGKVTQRCLETIYRIRRANGDAMVYRPHVKFVELGSVMLPEPVSRLLTAAAERRSMDAGDLAAQLIGGIVCKGSIDRVQQSWFRFENSRKLNTADSHGTAERKRASGDADMARDHLTPSEV